MAGRKFRDLPKGRATRKRRPEREDLVQGQRVEFNADSRIGDDGFNLGAEQQDPVLQGLKQRADAQAIATQEKPPAA